MSASTLALTSLVFACLGLVLGFTGWILAIILKSQKKERLNLRKEELPVRVAYKSVLFGGLALGIALLILIAAGAWWGLAPLLVKLTPGTLAILCIILGPVPLLITAFASGIARILGCSVDASGAKNCVLLGWDIGPLLHTLFMAYWLVFLTAGFAFIGLMGSGIWALITI